MNTLSKFSLFLAVIFLISWPSTNVFAQSGMNVASLAAAATGGAGGVNAAMGAMEMAECDPPDNIMPCIMAVMSFAQVGADSKGKSGSEKTKDSLTGSGYNPSSYGDSSSGYNPTDTSSYSAGTEGTAGSTNTNAAPLSSTPGSTNNGNSSTIGSSGGNGSGSGPGEKMSLTNNDGTLKSEAALLKMAENNADQMALLGAENLAKKGYSYDPLTNSVITPNGSVPTSKFSSRDAMIGAGASPDFLDKLDAKGKELTKKLMGKVNVADGGGDGMGGGGGSKSSSSSANSSLANKSLFAKNATRSPANVSGLKKMYNGEPIGVAADDIFGMISRCYERKAKQDTFIK